MRSCTHILLDERPCGLDIGATSATHCDFHHPNSVRQPITDTQVVKDYLQESTREYADLSGVSFEGVSFDDTTLGAPRPANFQYSHLQSCKFKQCTMTDARFAECRLIDTSFLNCRFKGNLFRLNAYCRGKGPLFVNCSFDTSKSFGLIDLSHTIAYLEHGLFSHCRAYTYTLILNNAVLDMPRLRLHLTDDKRLENPSVDLVVVGARTLSLGAITLNGSFHFVQAPRNPDYDPSIYFTGIDFSQMRSAQLTNVNLKEALFENSHIQTVKFAKPIWDEEDGYPIIADDRKQAKSTRPIGASLSFS